MTKIETSGRIEKIERKDEIILPIGHYALINCKNKLDNIQPKISIYGLGSCIALILFDYKKNVSGMSHILLPKVHNKIIIKFPHKYANLSAKTLTQDLISQGAAKENIRAIIVGGSTIFDSGHNIIGLDNTIVIKEELEKLKIKIIKEDTGGSKGRIVIFDTKDFSVYVKSTGKRDYLKI